MKLAGIALVVIGLVLAITGGLSYRTTDEIADIGPLEIRQEETKRFPVSPVAGVIIASTGLALLVFSRRQIN